MWLMLPIKRKFLVDSLSEYNLFIIFAINLNHLKTLLYETNIIAFSCRHG